MDDRTARRLGARITLLRERATLSLGELSARADIAKSYLSKLEKGESLNVGLATLTSIATALGLTVHDLLPRPAEDVDSENAADRPVRYPPPEHAGSVVREGPRNMTPAGPAASGVVPPSPPIATVQFEMIAGAIPTPLQEFLDEQIAAHDPVPADTARALAVLKFRGKHPETKEDYRAVYHMLRRSTS